MEKIAIKMTIKMFSMGQNTSAQTLLKCKVSETPKNLMYLLQHISSAHNEGVFTYVSFRSTNM